MALKPQRPIPAKGARAPSIPSRSRPMVKPVIIRPSAPPQKVMPKIPPPVAPKVISRAQPSHPVPLPTRTQPPIKVPGKTPPISVPRHSPMVITSAKKQNYVRPNQQPVSPTSAPVLTAAAVASVGILALNASAAHQEISSDVWFLKNALDDVQGQSSLPQLTADVSRIDSDLREVVDLLESARNKKYFYQKDIEEILFQCKSEWDAIRSQVLSNIQQQSRYIGGQLPTLNPLVTQLNSRISNPAAARPYIQSTQSQVNSLLTNIQQIENSIKQSYAHISQDLSSLKVRLTQVHWVLDQVSDAKFQLPENENVVMAVSARWDKEGNEDPEGILFLTDKRLIFEQKEKIATKKVLFITTEKELVQQVLIDVPLQKIKDAKSDNKGLFGNQDFIFIEFDDPKLRTVPFHINGQDSKYWKDLIRRTQSGEIEQERVTGSEISLSTLIGPFSVANIYELQNEFGALRDELMLKESRQRLSELENTMRSLERNLGAVRSKGYLIEKNLESEIKILAAQWDRVKSNSEKTIEIQAAQLSGQANNIQQLLSQLLPLANQLSAAKPIYMQAKSAIASARAQAVAADLTVSAQYEAYEQEVMKISAHLDWVDWMLDALSTASFRLLATESGVAATEAVWERPNLEAENGILFLTDQRLLWEDRVGTFELDFEVPLQSILDCRYEYREEDGRELLIFTLSSGAPYPTVLFSLSLPVGEDWVKMVGRARSGDYTKDRAVEIDPSEIEKVKNAPQQCSRCGAALTAPVLRGQTEIQCEYCGNVIRL